MLCSHLHESYSVRAWLSTLIETNSPFAASLPCGTHHHAGLGKDNKENYYFKPSICLTMRSLTGAHSRKQPSLVTTTFSYFRGGCLRELRLY